MKWMNKAFVIIDEMLVGALFLLGTMVMSAIGVAVAIVVVSLPVWTYVIGAVLLSWLIGRIIDYHENHMEEE